ncbi:MAG TPA: hypothetical protein PKD70_03230 [Saprospiraceae bacterium]|nr:hypothetical protein [Saprospiraceae bacterium]HMP12867.1 hypothetical protein [Saprospiraceae bacterium]
MTIPQEYFIPYLLSNTIALVLLLAAWRAPRWTRWTMALVFLVAGCTNAWIANTTPQDYLSYASLAITAYRRFIEGWFAQHIQVVVTLIAVGQLTVALLLALPRKWRRLGVLGGMLFFVAIAPLGIGSAFPCSIILAITLFLIDRHDRQSPGAAQSLHI